MSSSTNNGYFNGTLLFNCVVVACSGAATQGSAFVNSDVYHAKQGKGSFAREPTYEKTMELLNYGQEACQNPSMLEKTGNLSNIPALSPESAWNRSEEELKSSRRGVSPPFVNDPPFWHQHHDLGRTGDSDCTRDQLFHSIGDFILTPEAHTPVELMRAVRDERDSYLARTRNGQSCTQAFRPTFNTNVNPGQQFLDRGPASHHHLVGTGQPMRFVLIFVAGCKMIISRWRTQI
ncbi:hypothetical protein K439DRAFT_1548405 [Ramaria rubella]|nr:hypothetical protein K439DRAFT_1548405 [Ramaria rubella]